MVYLWVFIYFDLNQEEDCIYNMGLVESYEKVKPSIVAIVSKIGSDPSFPEIIGTGFIAREDGIIMTCKHVIDLINKLPRPKNMSPDEWPVMILLFRLAAEGMQVIPLSVVGAGLVAKYK